MNKIQQLYKATFRFIALHFFLTFFHIINSIIWLSHIKTSGRKIHLPSVNRERQNKLLFHIQKGQLFQVNQIQRSENISGFVIIDT